jgi:hypothetical protein
VCNELTGSNDSIIRNFSTFTPPKRSDEDLLLDLNRRILKELNFEKADFFYYKMDLEYKSDLNNFIFEFSSVFEEKKVVSPIHNSKGDITCYILQKMCKILRR